MFYILLKNVVKNLTIFEGFYAWFHLQHYRGYNEANKDNELVKYYIG